MKKKKRKSGEKKKTHRQAEIKITPIKELTLEDWDWNSSNPINVRVTCDNLFPELIRITNALYEEKKTDSIKLNLYDDSPKQKPKQLTITKSKDIHATALNASELSIHGKLFFEAIPDDPGAQAKHLKNNTMLKELDITFSPQRHVDKLNQENIYIWLEQYKNAVTPMAQSTGPAVIGAGGNISLQMTIEDSEKQKHIFTFSNRKKFYRIKTNSNSKKKKSSSQNSDQTSFVFHNLPAEAEKFAKAMKKLAPNFIGLFLQEPQEVDEKSVFNVITAYKEECKKLTSTNLKIGIKVFIIDAEKNPKPIFFQKTKPNKISATCKPKTHFIFSALPENKQNFAAQHKRICPRLPFVFMTPKLTSTGSFIETLKEAKTEFGVLCGKKNIACWLDLKEKKSRSSSKTRTIGKLKLLQDGKFQLQPRKSLSFENFENGETSKIKSTLLESEILQGITGENIIFKKRKSKKPPARKNKQNPPPPQQLTTVFSPQDLKEAADQILEEITNSSLPVNPAKPEKKKENEITPSDIPNPKSPHFSPTKKKTVTVTPDEEEEEEIPTTNLVIDYLRICVRKTTVIQQKRSVKTYEGEKHSQHFQSHTNLLLDKLSTFLKENYNAKSIKITRIQIVDTQGHTFEKLKLFLAKLEEQITIYDKTNSLLGNTNISFPSQEDMPRNTGKSKTEPKPKPFNHSLGFRKKQWKGKAILASKEPKIPPVTTQENKYSKIELIYNEEYPGKNYKGKEYIATLFEIGYMKVKKEVLKIHYTDHDTDMKIEEKRYKQRLKIRKKVLKTHYTDMNTKEYNHPQRFHVTDTFGKVPLDLLSTFLVQEFDTTNPHKIIMIDIIPTTRITSIRQLLSILKQLEKQTEQYSKEKNQKNTQPKITISFPTKEGTFRGQMFFDRERWSGKAILACAEENTDSLDGKYDGISFKFDSEYNPEGFHLPPRPKHAYTQAPIVKPKIQIVLHGTHKEEEIELKTQENRNNTTSVEIQTQTFGKHCISSIFLPLRSSSKEIQTSEESDDIIFSKEPVLEDPIHPTTGITSRETQTQLTYDNKDHLKKKEKEEEIEDDGETDEEEQEEKIYVSLDSIEPLSVISNPAENLKKRLGSLCQEMEEKFQRKPRIDIYDVTGHSAETILPFLKTIETDIPQKFLRPNGVFIHFVCRGQNSQIQLKWSGKKWEGSGIILKGDPSENEEEITKKIRAPKITYLGKTPYNFYRLEMTIYDPRNVLNLPTAHMFVNAGHWLRVKTFLTKKENGFSLTWNNGGYGTLIQHTLRTWFFIPKNASNHSGKHPGLDVLNLLIVMAKEKPDCLTITNDFDGFTTWHAAIDGSCPFHIIHELALLTTTDNTLHKQISASSSRGTVFHLIADKVVTLMKTENYNEDSMLYLFDICILFKTISESYSQNPEKSEFKARPSDRLCPGAIIEKNLDDSPLRKRWLTLLPADHSDPKKKYCTSIQAMCHCNTPIDVAKEINFIADTKILLNSFGKTDEQGRNVFHVIAEMVVKHKKTLKLVGPQKGLDNLENIYRLLQKIEKPKDENPQSTLNFFPFLSNQKSIPTSKIHEEKNSKDDKSRPGDIIAKKLHHDAKENPQNPKERELHKKWLNLLKKWLKLLPPTKTNHKKSKTSGFSGGMGSFSNNLNFSTDDYSHEEEDEMDGEKQKKNNIVI